MSTTVNHRKNKRTYQLKPTRITLKGTTFQLHDISSGGIGIVLPEGEPGFATGERIESIPLPLKEGVAILAGVVSHISISTAKTTCGIRFLLSGNQFDQVMQFRQERAM